MGSNDSELLLISDYNLTEVSNSSISKNVSVNDKRDENLAIIEITILASIFVLITIGNICVLIALAVKRFQLTRMYYFLLHLCISDLITGFFTVLPQLAWDITYRFHGGNFTCKSVKCMQILGPYLSSYVLVMTAIDRYQAICFPLTNCTWTPRRSKLMISLAWIISIICSAPQAIIFSYQEVPGSGGIYDCWGTFPKPWGERIYVTWYATSVFFIPLIIITYAYLYICREVWSNVHRKRKSLKLEISLIESRKTINSTRTKHNKCNHDTDNDNEENDRCSSIKQLNQINPRTHSIYGISRAKIKTVKVTVVVVICYIACSSPFICVQMWAYWYPGAQDTSSWTGSLIAILMLLSSLNSCVNPWIYLLFNPNLMNALSNFCHCNVFRNNHKSNYNYSYSNNRRSLRSSVRINSNNY